MRWLRKILGLCQHKWERHEKIEVYVSEKTDDLPVYLKQVLQCSLCGSIKVVKI